MSENKNDEPNEIEWQKSPFWSEVLDYCEDETSLIDIPETIQLKEKPEIRQNNKFIKLIRQNKDLSSISPLEKLLLSETKISSDNEDIDYDSLKLIDFKKNKIITLKENIIYYCASLKLLSNYKNNKIKEKHYEFYKDLETENFLACQKERNDIIHRYIDIDDSIKGNLLNKNFDSEILFPEKNEKNQILMKKLYLLSQKLSNFGLLELQDMNINELFDFLKEVNDMLKEINNINPYSFGVTLYHFIVNNFISLLEIISCKFIDNKDNSIKLILILREICSHISSIRIKLHFLKIIKKNLDILKEREMDYNANNILMKNYLNFNDINSQKNFNLIFLDFKTFLANEDHKEKIDNINNLSLYNHWTLNFKNNLYLFISNPYKTKSNQEKQFLIFFQIDLELNKVLNYGEITLINEENNKTEKIIDINISIRKEIIYLAYIIKSNMTEKEKYYFKYKMYNPDMININHNDEKNIIEFSSFIPMRLINDSKYIYCFSITQKIFIIKISYNFNEFKYATCLFNFKNFKMHNTLCINNYLIIENVIENKKYSAIINKYDEEKYTLEIFELQSHQQVKNNLEENIILNITFNDNRYIITKLYVDNLELYFNIIQNDEKNKYLLMPFSDCYLNYSIDNYYDKYLKEICFLLNLSCNNSINQANYLISSIYNFRQSDLKYIIQNIFEYNKCDKIMLYYIIILRSIIKNQIQSDEFKEHDLKNIIPFLKNLIINKNLEQDNNIYYEIMKEIILIVSFIKEFHIIELNDIKFILNQNQDIKRQLLILQLLLEQEKTNKDINLYKIIMDIEFNFIKQIFNNNENKTNCSESLKNYYLMNKIMKKATDILYKISHDKKIFVALLDLFLKISTYVNQICELYKNIINNTQLFCINNSILYNSFIFRSFYFILQKIIADKIYLKNNNIILSLYKNIISLDKININDISYDFYDLENIIEVKSSLFLNTNESGYQNDNNKFDYTETITLKEPKNLIIKASLTSHNNLNDFFNIKLIKNDNQSYLINLNFETGQIFRNVSKIEITMKNRDSIFLKDFIINIIPLKKDFPEKEYYLKKNNNDNKIILLIEKSIIYYFLFLFEDIYNQIDEFNNDKIISQFSKIYEFDIFKFININNTKTSNGKNISNPIIDKINQIIKKIENTLGFNANNFSKFLNQNLINSFEELNKHINNNINNEEEIKKINKIIKKEELNKDKKYKLLDMNKYDKIFDLFQKFLEKKNIIFYQKQKNQILDNLMKKIFFISIKYFDCLNKLDTLLKNINLTNDKPENFENFNLFYSIYEETSKIKIFFYEKRNEIDDKEKLDEMLKKFENILDFLYAIIFPSDDSSIEPNSLIAKCIVNLLSKKNFEIEEIKKYSEIQNMICHIKFIELMIISNLLNSLQNETNISFLLQLICEKIRKTNNIYNSFFDTIKGTDYLMLEKLKHQFHLLLFYLSNKLLQKKYCMTTEILFIENLIWKIRGRNFPILSQILKVFEELKNIHINNSEDIFRFEHDCMHNFKYFNKFAKYKIKFEIFKIIVEQIFEKNINKEISDITDLSLTRDISKISSVEYNDIIKIILSYFTDIQHDNIFYHDFILFFYKCFINSKKVPDYLKNNFMGQKVIKKIINIALDLKDKDNNINFIKDERKSLSQLIMIKLLYKILESYDDLYNSNEFLNENNEENTHIFIFKILLNNLNKFHDDDNIIKKYYVKILFLCSNKLKERKDCNEVEKLIKNNLGNNLNNLILLLIDENSGLIEDKFIINKDIDTNLSEFALFDSKGNNLELHGEIISFSYSSQDNFLKYISNFSIASYNKNSFQFFLSNSRQKYEYALVLIEEHSDLESFNLSNMEIISIQNITIIKNEDDDLEKKFIENYKHITLCILLNYFKINELNDKGIYYMFRIIQKLIKILNKEEKAKIFEYLWKFYIESKKDEEQSQFVSLEFIENIINKHINLLYPKNKLFEKEIKEQNLIKEFKYIITNYDFYMELKIFNIKLKFGDCIRYPIFKDNKDEELSNIYNINYELNYLYFYDYNEKYIDDVIEDNSILISDSINSSFKISELSGLIRKNRNKVKIIFIKNFNFNNEFNIELAQFIKNIKIPIFIIESNLVKILYEYFIEGKINIFDYLEKINTNNAKNYYDFLFNFKKEDIIKENIEETNDNKIGDKDDKIDDLLIDVDSLFKLEKNLDKKIFSKEKKIIYENLINKPKRFFKYGAVKLARRLIYDLICEEKYIISEFNGNIDDLVNIFNYLCSEYYFNINIISKKMDFISIDNYLLKQKLNNYLLFFSSNKSDDKNKNNWLLKYFDYLKKELLLSQSQEKYASINLSSYLSKFNISNNSKVDIIKTIFFSDQDIEFDVFLFFSKNSLDNPNFPVKIFLELIETKIKYLLKIKFSLTLLTNHTYAESEGITIKINNDSEITYMFKIMNNLYEFFIKNYNGNNFEKFKEIFIPNQIHNVMKNLIDEKIDLAKFFYNENEEGELNYSKMRTQNISLIIEYAFKYFDYCLLIYLKQEDVLDLFEYWNHSKKDIFKFYCNYKLLYINKNSEISNKKEMYSLLFYYNNIYNNKNETIPMNINDVKYNLGMNTMNIYRKKIKNSDNIKFSLISSNGEFNSYQRNNLYNLIILYYNKNIENFSFIDIISIQDFKIKNDINLKIGKDLNEIFIYPTGRLTPIIYANNLLNNEIDQDKKIFILNKKIYTNHEFYRGKYFNEPFYINNNGEAFYASKENMEKYIWLEYVINKKEKIPKIKCDYKISYLYADYINCFIIDINGNLYGIGSNFYNQITSEKKIIIKELTKIPLPNNCQSFIKCISDKECLLCLIKENDGKNKLYVKGNNTQYQCGITGINLITDLTKCQFEGDIQIKDIFTKHGFSSAITIDGKLYIWGTIHSFPLKKKEIKIPTLVNTGEYNDIIVEHMSINPVIFNEQFYIIGKSYNEIQNGNYDKKIYNLDIYNDKFIFKEIIPWNNDNIIPLKIFVNVEDGIEYILYFNEYKFIHEINQNKNISYDLLHYFKSGNLNTFIDEINSITDKDISLFVEIIEEMKEKLNKENIIENFSYEEFIAFIKDKKVYKQILKLLEKNKNFLFNYLKCRYLINSENYMNYYNTNLLSSYKHLLQPLITKNSLFLSSENRMKFFLSKLNMARKSTYLRINIDRIKSNSFIEKFNENSKQIDKEINTTIFGQVFQSLEREKSQDFFIKKNNRLFRVNLIGENAIDEGGPYHEIISEMCKDLQSDYLDLFIKTPNNKNNLGNLRDKYIINPDADKIMHKKAYEFIGKLMVLSISSGELLNLNLHPIIFKLILNNEISFSDYDTIDYNSFKLIEDLTEALNKEDSEFINQTGLNFEIKNSNGSDLELIPGGKGIYVNIDNVSEYINLCKIKRIEEFNFQIKEIQKGLFAGISFDLLQVLNWKQFEQLICGKIIFDTNDFKNHTNYDGYNKDEQIIKWFWEWFENISEEDKYKYLRFVSGRTRLPQTSLGYNYSHIINKISNKKLYPTSHTCFFTLHLPNYENKNILNEKLDYAIENSVEIIDS